MKESLIILIFSLCVLSSFSQNYHWKWVNPTDYYSTGLAISEDSIYYWHSSVQDYDTIQYQSYSFTPAFPSRNPLGGDITLLRLNAEGASSWGKQAFGSKLQWIIGDAPFPSGVALLGLSQRGASFTIDNDTIEEWSFVLVFHNDSDSLIHYFKAPKKLVESERFYISFDSYRDSTFTLTMGFLDSISVGDTSFSTIPRQLLHSTLQGGLLLKYSYDGELLWARKLGDGQILPRDHFVDEAGNIFLLGTYTKWNALLPVLGNDTLSGNGVFLAKISATNELLWTKSIEVVNSMLWAPPTELSLKQSPDGSIMICAEFYQGGGVIMNRDTMGSSDKPSLMLMKLNEEGNILWAEFPDIERTGPVPYTTMAVGPEGQVAISGQLRGTAIFGEDTLRSDGNNDADMFLVVYDSAGNVDYSTTSNTNNAAPRFQASANVWGFNHLGELIVTGYFSGPNFQLGPFSIDGFPGHNFIAALAPGPGPSGIESQKTNYMMIAPNPATEHIHIRLAGNGVTPGKPYSL
ncbi:MAG: hypothetical protein R3B47_02290, partial [Bacteroidia bacterium]